MTIASLEKKLKPLEAPVDNELLRWLYLHLPPQPIKGRKMHHGYSEAIRILANATSGKAVYPDIAVSAAVAAAWGIAAYGLLAWRLARREA